MSRRLIVLLAVLCVFGASGSAPASSPSAESGLDAIHSALDRGEIDSLQAVRRYRVAARRYRGADAAGEAFFSKGVEYEKLGRTADAANAYLAILSRYPDSVYMLPAADALIDIGASLFDGAFPAGRELRLAGRIFNALSAVDLSPESQAFVSYKRALWLLESGRLVEAEEGFNFVLEEHPAQPWREKADYMLGEVYARRVGRPSRDQTQTRNAIAHFESFLNRYPDSALVLDARARLAGLRENKAEHLYNVCLFYFRAGEKDSFEIYYRLLMGNFPETEAAVRAAAYFKF